MLKCFYKTKWTKLYIDKSGKVWSKNKRTNNGKLIERKLGFNKYRGYLCVTISLCDGKGGRKTLPVHRLVAKAFVPNPKGFSVVNHIDGNKKNNSASNLEWTTPAGNAKHAQKNGLLKSRKGHLIKYTQDDYIKWGEEYNKGIKYREIAKKYNVPNSTVWFAVHGKRGK